MLKRTLLTVTLLALSIAGALTLAGARAGQEAEPAEPAAAPDPDQELVVIWTSGDPEVAEQVVLPYVSNSKRLGWWQEVTLIVWGPSAPLAAGREELQAALREMAEAGVKLEACRVCTDRYGVSEDLERIGVDVKYMGVELTEYIKEGRHVLTF